MEGAREQGRGCERESEGGRERERWVDLGC